MMERQELLDVLGDAMRGIVHDDLLGGRLRQGRVKSRLLEAHAPEPSSDGVAHLLTSVASDADLAVEVIGDSLWALVGTEDAFLIDALNPRFWLLHSTAPADRLRRLLRRHLLLSSRLDQAWFSSEQLQRLEGERRWVRSSFNSDTLQPNESGGVVPRRWKVQVEGENPEELLDLLS